MKKSIFYKIYFSFIALFLVALTVGLIYFNGVLKDYEAGQPEHIAETVISKVKTHQGFTEILKKYNIDVSKYENENTIKKFYNTEIKGKKLKYSPLVNYPENVDLAYGIYADDIKIFDIFMLHKGGKYNIKSVNLNSEFYKTFTVSAAQNVEIKVNGITVNNNDRKNAPLPEIAKKYISKQIAINKQIITLDKMLCEPTSIVAISEGEKTVLTGINGVYEAKQTFAELQKVIDIASKGATTYSYYMNNDSSLSELAQYVSTSTEFYRSVCSTDVSYPLKHTKGIIKDLTVTEIHKYNDNLYSCHVELVNVMYKKKLEHKDYFKKDIYLIPNGNSFKIIDMQNPENN